MKKLSLRLDDLRVDTFQTASSVPPAGTVHAHSGMYCNPSEGQDHCEPSVGGVYVSDCTCWCDTYTQGNDDTCINCTRQAGTCTENDYFCNVVTEGTCWTQQGCC